jgi:hypothetical protein
MLLRWVPGHESLRREVLRGGGVLQRQVLRRGTGLRAPQPQEAT